MIMKKISILTTIAVLFVLTISLSGCGLAFLEGIGEAFVINDYEIEDGTRVVKYIGNDTKVKIPAGGAGVTITSLGDSAFKDNDKIVSVDMNQITHIGDYAFSGCTSLTSVSFCSITSYIGDEAFCKCSSLAELELPKSVTLGRAVFKECTSLTEIIFDGTMEKWGDKNHDKDWNKGSSISKVICSDGEIDLQE